MIRQEFNIGRYGWHVTVFYDVTPNDTGRVMRALRNVTGEQSDLEDAYSQMMSGRFNEGFTCVNRQERETVMAIGRTADARQFYNTLQHEQRHLETQIARTFRLDPYGEEICYLAGDIASSMFPACKELLCDCCRNKYRKIL